MYHFFEMRVIACMSTTYEKDQYTEWEMRYTSKKENGSFIGKGTEI